MAAPLFVLRLSLPPQVELLRSLRSVSPLLLVSFLLFLLLFFYVANACCDAPVASLPAAPGGGLAVAVPRGALGAASRNEAFSVADNDERKQAHIMFVGWVSLTNVNLLNDPVGTVSCRESISLQGSLMRNFAATSLEYRDIIIMHRLRIPARTFINNVSNTGELVAFGVMEARFGKLKFKRLAYLGTTVVERNELFMVPEEVSVSVDTFPGSVLLVIRNCSLHIGLWEKANEVMMKEASTKISGKSFNTLDCFTVPYHKRKVDDPTDHVLIGTFVSRMFDPNYLTYMVPSGTFGDSAAVKAGSIELQKQHSLQCSQNLIGGTGMLSVEGVRRFRMIDKRTKCTQHDLNMLVDTQEMPRLRKFIDSFVPEDTFAASKYEATRALELMQAWLGTQVGEQWFLLFEGVGGLIDRVSQDTQDDTLWGHEQFSIGHLEDRLSTVLNGMFKNLAHNPAALFTSRLGRLPSFVGNEFEAVEVIKAELALMKPRVHDNFLYLVKAHQTKMVDTSIRSILSKSDVSKRERSAPIGSTDGSTVDASTTQPTNKIKGSAGKSKGTKVKKGVTVTKGAICYTDLLYRLQAIQPDGTTVWGACMKTNCQFEHKSLPSTAADKEKYVRSVFTHNTTSNLLATALLKCV